MIANERLTTYIHSLDAGCPPYLRQMEQEAREALIPVIRRETQSFLRTALALYRPHSILEVGTAIGFSALLMCEYGPEDCQITTIENYAPRIAAAKENFRKYNRQEQIHLLEGDAGELLAGLTGVYDWIFMDAAKGQYIHWLPEILRLLAPGGVLLSDNVLQEGEIIQSRFLVKRRDRTIHKRMREYLYELTHHEELQTCVLPLGDGLAMSVKNVKMENALKEIVRKKPELLIPANSLEVLKIAVIYGADAVYVGGDAYGLRAKARNFSMEEMREGIAFAHSRGVKVYVTANILAHNSDLDGVRAYFQELKEIQPDALIISDPGIYDIACEVCPEIERHISTQANNTNYGTYLFWHRMGAKRVVSARELSLEEIREIRQRIPADMEIETFIHGAMCISYSGRCLLSNYFTGRDANQGACTHPCRWKYAVVEEQRPGVYLPVYENDRGTYLFNSKDLCMIEHMDDLLEAGIDSFKIEGRMRAALYVATVARTYRKAIDDCMESVEKYRENIDWYREQIGNCTYRQFTTGFFYGKPDEHTQIYDENTYEKGYTYLGYVEAVDGRGLGRITQKNKFSVGEAIEIMRPDGTNQKAVVLELLDEEGRPRQSAPHSREVLYVRLNGNLNEYDLLRREE